MNENFLRVDDRARAGYMKADFDDARVTLTGVADTEQILFIVGNKLSRAAHHLISCKCNVTANASAAVITLKCYGSFDGTTYRELLIENLATATAGATSEIITSGTLTGVMDFITWAGSLGIVPYVYPFIKWTITEATNNGAVGTIDAAVSGI